MRAGWGIGEVLLRKLYLQFASAIAQQDNDFIRICFELYLGYRGLMTDSGLSTVLDAAAGDFEYLSSRLKVCVWSWNADDGKLQASASSVAVKDSEPTNSELVEEISNHLVNFALPAKQYLKINHLSDEKRKNAEHARLQKKARRLFIKARAAEKRSGEFAELLLYTILCWQRRAPQLVSKMYLKTDQEMPVHGTDGIHIGYDDALETVVIYWGESKAVSSLSSAISSALDSIKTFLETGYKREVDIVNDHFDLSSFSDEARTKIIKFLNPVEDDYNKRIEKFACLIMYDDNSYIDGNSDDEIHQLCTERLQRIVKRIPSRISKRKLNNKRFDFIFIPVSSVAIIRKLFQKELE